MDYMQYELNLDRLFAGFTTQPIQGPCYLWLQTKGLVTPDNGEMSFYNIMESFSNLVLGPYLKDGKHLISHISNALAILDQQKKARVYVNAPIMVKMQAKKNVSAGEPVYNDDIADVVDFRVHNIQIGNNEGVMFFFQVGWRQAFYFDLESLHGESRKIPVEKELARIWAMLTFNEIFNLTNEDYAKLSNLGWFPFVSIRKSIFSKLVCCIKNNFDTKQAVKEIVDSVDNTMLDRIKDRFENNKFLQTEIGFLRKGLEHYGNADYPSCISVVWNRIEGIIRKLLTGSEKKVDRKVMTDALVAYARSKHPDSTLYFPQEFGVYLFEFYFKSFDFAPTKKDENLSRHTHSHGVSSIESYTQEKALIALLIFDQIAYYTK